MLNGVDVVKEPLAAGTVVVVVVVVDNIGGAGVGPHEQWPELLLDSACTKDARDCEDAGEGVAEAVAAETNAANLSFPLTANTIPAWQCEIRAVCAQKNQ